MHGRVTLADDVEALVLDPCYRGTDIEQRAAALGVPVEWHEGRVLAVADLRQRADYRGAGPVRVGLEVALAGLVDAQVVGRAVRSGRYRRKPCSSSGT